MQISVKKIRKLILESLLESRSKRYIVFPDGDAEPSLEMYKSGAKKDASSYGYDPKLDYLKSTGEGATDSDPERLKNKRSARLFATSLGAQEKLSRHEKVAVDAIGPDRSLEQDKGIELINQNWTDRFYLFSNYTQTIVSELDQSLEYIITDVKDKKELKMIIGDSRYSDHDLYRGLYEDESFDDLPDVIQIEFHTYKRDRATYAGTTSYRIELFPSGGIQIVGGPLNNELYFEGTGDPIKDSELIFQAIEEDNYPPGI